MSRIGKKPIAVPAGVKVELRDHTVSVKGPKGDLSWTFPPEVTVKVDGGQIVVERVDESSRARAMHGTARALLANMVRGVDQGYSIQLEIYGTGYSCKVQGNALMLNVGYMGLGFDRDGKPKDQFSIPIPAGLKVTVEVPAARGESEPAKLTVSGADKQQVGQFAAEVRALRPPEPYKGKGIRYAGEHVRRKQGKAFAGGGG
ncbi:MAG TPA: 50S ribosomal protein L6 [Phycisphaerae bacterium]|jgi:large subunit ribosomal protein L6|nr:50S ribosomal protein L6 [Phycisphaerae bacterium]HOB75758.1 50S ribosomal protein L6 [Phycisphaerae bacterium]HOJ55610.1 50S ribosomal protein L6 [Phycisphaerae bacterium]HOL27694.1 50S ribosomal protein L6 [Phycisphaerae bacterium]HPP21924.1 50S ribosomal protein L6 [Phycisphaerae bacterium]